jgi:hypothetical protein
MGVRLIIIGATFLFYAPIMLTMLWMAAHPCAPWGPENYILAVRHGLTIPFVGTCPFPFRPEKGFTEADLFYWPALATFLTAGLGVSGLIMGKNKPAIIFVAVLVLSWLLTVFRLGVLPALNSN